MERLLTTPAGTPAPAEARRAQKLLRILAELQKIDPAFPLQYAVCLIEIAQEEGLSLTALAERTNLTLSTVSRIVGALSKNRQRGAPYGLVRVAMARHERRRKEIHLTARGRAVIAGLYDAAGK